MLGNGTVFSPSSISLLRCDRNGRILKWTFEGELVSMKNMSLNSELHHEDIRCLHSHWEKLAQLRHEQLLQYHLLLTPDDKTRYLVPIMDLCHGSMLDYCRKTLDKSVASHVKATDVMWQTICAIDYLQSQKIDYGEIKLDNVLFWKRDSKSRRVLVKLTGYGYNFENNTNTNGYQLGCLFYSAATKNEAKPIEPVPPNSLTEIDDDDHKDLASKLIHILINPDYSNRLEVGTLLRHPLFTRCSDDARLRLIKDDTLMSLFKDEEKLLLWKNIVNESPDENFDDLKYAFLSFDDPMKIVTEANQITPQLFSEYVWHSATESGGMRSVMPKENNKTHSIEINGKLGKGTYGKVYKCEYTDGNGTRYPAACKKCNRKTEAKEVFKREIETLGKLNHLFVVKYLDVVEMNSKKFIVMELCDGSLKDYVEGKLETIPLDSLDEKILIGQVCLGLAYIHDKGIIHKDLKLENILLKRHSNRLVLAKIADFGLAKELKPGKTKFSETSHPGTEKYMAPELLNAKDGVYQANFASDVYALGITIARIALKGEHPFIDILRSMVNGLVPQNLQGLSWDLIDLILKLIDKDPSKRPKIILVLLHPYFSLTNDRTQRHFAEQLWTDFSLIPSKEDRGKVIREIFNCQNFRKWYTTFSKDKPDIDEDIAKIENNIPLFREVKPEKKNERLAKEYEKIINKAITAEYDTNIGSKINQVIPELPWSRFDLLDVSIWGLSKSTESETQTSTVIPELQWSSFYNDDEEIIDEFWKIKFHDEKSEDSIREMIKIVGKCNVSERTWSTILDLSENFESSLLLNAVQSYASNAPKVTDMILRRYGNTKNVRFGELVCHIAAASNEGNHAAEIMQVTLKYPNYSTELVGFDSIGLTSLLCAVKNESQSGPKIVELLISKGLDPNTPYFAENATLVQFAAQNEGEHAADILKQLLDKGGACDTPIGYDNFKPIHLATSNSGDSALKLFDLLLEKRGTNVIHERTGRNELLLIHLATMNPGGCGPEILQKLLNIGANVNAVSNDGMTPLHLASLSHVQRTSIMKILLENGGNPNAADLHGRTPIHFVTSDVSGECPHEKLKLLLDNGGKLTSKDTNGLNPVHYTLLNMGVRGAEMRKLVGINPESFQLIRSHHHITHDTTLLHYIVSLKLLQIPTRDPLKYDCKVDLVQLILDNGGNPNAEDEDGRTPVHEAVDLDGSYDGLTILKLLLKNGGDANLKDKKEQYAPIHYAAMQPCSINETASEQMKILLEHGGNANACGKSGITPLHWATNNSGIHGPELTKVLLEHGGNPNTTDDLKKTSLHFAIQNKNDQLRLDITKQLLEKGGNPNAGDILGNTPVHYVIVEKRSNSLEVLKILLKHGGDILQENKNKETPHSLATRTRSNQYCTPEVKKFVIKTYSKMK